MILPFLLRNPRGEILSAPVRLAHFLLRRSPLDPDRLPLRPQNVSHSSHSVPVIALMSPFVLSAPCLCLSPSVHACTRVKPGGAEKGPAKLGHATRRRGSENRPRARSRRGTFTLGAPRLCTTHRPRPAVVARRAGGLLFKALVIIILAAAADGLRAIRLLRESEQLLAQVGSRSAGEGNG